MSYTKTKGKAGNVKPTIGQFAVLIRVQIFTIWRFRTNHERAPASLLLGWTADRFGRRTAVIVTLSGPRPPVGSRVTNPWGPFLRSKTLLGLPLDSPQRLAWGSRGSPQLWAPQFFSPAPQPHFSLSSVQWRWVTVDFLVAFFPWVASSSAGAWSTSPKGFKNRPCTPTPTPTLFLANPYAPQNEGRNHGRFRTRIEDQQSGGDVNLRFGLILSVVEPSNLFHRFFTAFFRTQILPAGKRWPTAWLGWPYCRDAFRPTSPLPALLGRLFTAWEFYLISCLFGPPFLLLLFLISCRFSSFQKNLKIFVFICVSTILFLPFVLLFLLFYRFNYLSNFFLLFISSTQFDIILGVQAAKLAGYLSLSWFLNLSTSYAVCWLGSFLNPRPLVETRSTAFLPPHWPLFDPRTLRMVHGAQQSAVSAAGGELWLLLKDLMMSQQFFLELFCNFLLSLLCGQIKLFILALYSINLIFTIW